jgi:small conductance mechanosensitive channel
VTIPVVGEFYPFLARVVRICIIILIAFIASRVIQKFVSAIRLRIFNLMQKRAVVPDLELEKRAATLGGIIRKTAVIMIWALAGVMALREGGFDIAPILAGAGVLGLAVGFGAQNLVRDVISGLFILVENQIRVNDVAVINGTGGLVEEINLRTTVLRSQDGTVHIFPNGAIERLANMTREYSYYVFDISVAYKEDTDRVVQAVRAVGEQLMAEEPYKDMILEPLDMMGLEKVTDSSAIIKARIKTRPIQQWTVGREMNRRIKMKFAELGIEVPPPSPAVGFDPAKPLRLQMDGITREDVAQIVREVLAESERAKNTAPGDSR